MALTPAKFCYIRPENIEKAIEILSDNEGEAKLLGGGQSLIPLLKTRIVSFEKLIDIGNLPSLNHISRENGGYSIGSATRISQLESSGTVHEQLRMLHEASMLIADPLVRNMGTIGGNVSHADPGNDLPPVMIAYDATFRLRGKKGERSVKAEDFFLGPFETEASPDEVMTEIYVPSAQEHEGSSFMKVRRMSGDFSVVSAASRIRVGDDLRVTDARIVVASATPSAVRLRDVEESIIDSRIDDSTFHDIMRRAPENLEIMDDQTVSHSYRLFALSNSVAKTVENAYSRATGK